MNEQRVLRLVEVASVVAILAVVIALAVPKRAELDRAATAARVLDDVGVVRQAIYRFYSDSAYFPVQRAGQPIPAGLARYLPAGFTARQPYGTLDYRNWPIVMRDSSVASAPNVVGVTVTVFDPRIGAAAEARAHDLAKFVVGNKYTFLFFGV